MTSTRIALASLVLALAACTSSPEPTPDAAPTSTTASIVTSEATPGTSAAPRPSTPATAAATATPRGTVVAAAGDIACDPKNPAFRGGAGTATKCRQRATSDLVLEMKPKAVFVLGDLQYEVGRLAAFEASYDPSWGRFKDITWPTPGNHEYGTGVTRGYFEYFGRRAGTKTRSWYSTDIGGWHVVSLNSNCRQIDGCERGSPQEKWLRADLAASKARCTLAIMHDPRWTSDFHGPAEKVDDLWRTLADMGADVVLAAHGHHYERFEPINAAGEVDEAAGMRQFIVGTGGNDLIPTFGAARGSAVREWRTFGVLKLELQPAAYTWEFVPVPGASFTDSGSGSCH